MGLTEIPTEVRRRIERLETEVRMLRNELKKLEEKIKQMKKE